MNQLLDVAESPMKDMSFSCFAGYFMSLQMGEITNKYEKSVKYLSIVPNATVR